MKTKFFRFFMNTAAIVILAISCGKDSPPDPNEKETEKIKDNIVLLNDTAGKIEKVLAAGEQTAFINFISPAYQKYYKEAVQKNPSGLVQFANVFKTRKLIKCDGYFAVFEVQHNGKLFEITMFLDDDGNWKLKDL